MTPTHVGELPVAAASGIAAWDGALAVVADDELELVVCGLDGALRTRHVLVAGTLPDEHGARKQAKPDLEALTPLLGGLLAIGSCSTLGRRRACWLPAGPGGPVHAIELAPLAATLDRTIPALNLEGAAVLGDALILFHRGGAAGPTVWIELALADVARGLAARVLDVTPRRLVPLELGDIDGVPLAITDACADGDALWATATAEDTPDPIADGVITGSALLRLDARGVAARWPLALAAKPEGVTLLDDALWLCVDADDRARPSPLYRAPRPC